MVDGINESDGVEAPRRPGRGRRWLALAGPACFAQPAFPAFGGLLSDRPVRRRTLVVAFVLLAVFYGLLWSPWWYPVSDSALYLCLARNLAEGRGHSFLGAPYREVPPLYPLFLAGLFGVSRSYAWLHVSSIALTWLSSLLSYVALRRWLPARATLLVVALTAATYWHYRNATTLMTEPLFLCLFWTSWIGLGRCCRAGSLRLPWLLVALGAFALAFATRLAAVLLVPGLAIALWYGTKHLVGPGRRLVLVACLLATAAACTTVYLAWHRHRPPLDGAQAAEATVPPGPALFSPRRPLFAFEARWPRGIRPLDAAWASARWVGEALVGPARVALAARSPRIRVAAAIPAFVALGLCLLGALRLLRAGGHWLVWPMTYAIPVIYRGGLNVTPRYVNPILPLVLLAVFVGLQTAGGWAGRSVRGEKVRRAAGRLAGPALVVVLILGNLPPYVGELYLRHFRKGPYYDVARAGSYARGIDAAAYVRSSLPPDTVLILNERSLHRQIVLMTGRCVFSAKISLASAADESALRDLARASGNATTFLVYFGKWSDWPTWHFGFPRRDPDDYWGLYRLSAEGKLVRILPPVDRDFFRRVPSSRI